MSDEKKTIKFQMLMSPSEAEAIDDWGFSHRIRTRAEAIRRLCLLGMEHDDSKFVHIDDHLSNSLLHFIDAWSTLLDHIRKGTIPNKRELAKVTSQIFNGRMDVGDARIELMKIRSIISALMGTKDVSEAIDAARDEQITLKNWGDIPDLRVPDNYSWELSEEDLRLQKAIEDAAEWAREQEGPDRDPRDEDS